MSNTSSTTAPATLPADFTPGDHDVVIGKGKKFYFHAGNQWLRTVVAERIDEYSQAMTKADKSNIISSVVDFVRSEGRFVKLDNAGKWVYAEPLLCREKCSQTFRDNLAQTYRSSNVAKRNKRRQEQQEKTNFAIANMVLYPPMQVSSNKRMRTSYNSYTSTSTSTCATQQLPFNTCASPTSSYDDMEPLPIPSSPNSCATWFDWEMPMFTTNGSCDLPQPVDLEPISIQSAFHHEQHRHQVQVIMPQSQPESAAPAVPAAEVTPNDFDGLFLDLSAPTNHAVDSVADDDFEPLPALSGNVKPLKEGYPTSSRSSFVMMGNEFQRRTAAAFAA